MPPRSWQLLQERRDAWLRTLLLCFFQPLCLQLPSRKWLAGSQLVSSMCEVIDKYAKDFSHVRKPIFTVRVAAGCPSNGSLMRGKVVGQSGALLGCRTQGMQLLLGLLESSYPLQQPRVHRHAEVFRVSPKLSCFLCPGGFPAGCPHGLALCPAPFPGRSGKKLIQR